MPCEFCSRIHFTLLYWNNLNVDSITALRFAAVLGFCGEIFVYLSTRG